MKKASGFSIIEMLFVLGTLVVFFLLASQLFGSTMRVLTRSGVSIEPPIRFDAAISTLRADLFTAASWEISGQGQLLVHPSDGRTVVWQSDGKGELARSDPAERRSWQIGRAVEFRRQGAIVLIQPVGADDPADQIALACSRDILRSAP